MKPLLWTSCGALLLSAFASCEPYLSREGALAGKACDLEGRCAEGYECVSTMMGSECVPKGLESGSGSALPSPGAGGASAVVSEPDPEGSAGSANGEAGAGGAPGSAGAGGLPDAGLVEPGPEPEPSDAGCTNPVELFVDRDRDGFGSDALEDRIRDCPRDGYATQGGDCLDDPLSGNSAAVVNPGQTLFFDRGYPSAASPSGVSFDYNCDGVESPGPAFTSSLEVPDCSLASTPCAGFGIGYRGTQRTGPGENPLCGSVNFAICGDVAGGTCTLNELRDPNRPLLCN